MSGRCRACDKKLTDTEMCSKRRDRQQHKTLYQDLCYHCQGNSMENMLNLIPTGFTDEYEDD